MGKYVDNIIHDVDDGTAIHYVNSSDLSMYNTMKNVWCCRLEQIIYVIHKLKEYKNNDILQSMFDLYYQLKTELSQFNVICNQCILKEKYQKKLKIKHSKNLNY